MRIETLVDIPSAHNDGMLPSGSIGNVISGNRRSRQITVSFPKCAIWILLKGTYKILED